MVQGCLSVEELEELGQEIFLTDNVLPEEDLLPVLVEKQEELGQEILLTAAAAQQQGHHAVTTTS